VLPAIASLCRPSLPLPMALLQKPLSLGSWSSAS
jgi:hypothetical protein